MLDKIRPIIKWTGGKYDEFALFKAYIPTFERYVEPFFGGGGVFFALQPQNLTLINDKSPDLINFYQQIGKSEFADALLLYANAWDELSLVTQSVWKKCSINFMGSLNNEAELIDTIKPHLQQVLIQQKTLNSNAFIIDFEDFSAMLLNSIKDKAKRIYRICIKENRVFNKDEMYSHFETSIKGGAYLFFRKLLNQHYQQIIKLDAAKAAANWYFVREFCYGAMFRFNAKGDFNIPYGGIAYNKKKFRNKVNDILDEKIAQLFKRTTIYNLDFETFLREARLTENDFVFLDPPYDSEFSEYDQSAFTQADQIRLANFLLQSRAKWMVVIKETPFIRQIYTKANTFIATFDKKYTYNVRGRNNRAVTHLIITNYING